MIPNLLKEKKIIKKRKVIVSGVNLTTKKKTAFKYVLKQILI